MRDFPFETDHNRCGVARSDFFSLHEMITEMIQTNVNSVHRRAFPVYTLRICFNKMSGLITPDKNPLLPFSALINTAEALYVSLITLHSKDERDLSALRAVRDL